MSRPDPALQKTAALLAVAPRGAATEQGYLDLLGPGGPPAGGTAQSLMRTGIVPAIYERYWRPALGQLAKGVTGPTMAGERRLARELLDLRPGARVLDIACGPGNFTRDFGAVVGDGGLAVGIDASRTMLERAVRDTDAANVAYVRGDAVELPFANASFSALCCFAALHMFAEPFRALDQMTRVLEPGGRLAILTSCRRGPEPLRSVGAWLVTHTGQRPFERDELTDALRTRGFGHIHQQVHGLVQFVGARRADIDNR